jgi:hypothetical protein
MKRRWTKIFLARTVDPVSAAKWLIQVWRILHELSPSREKEKSATQGQWLQRFRQS